MTTLFLYAVAWAMSQGHGGKPEWPRALTLALMLTIVILAVFGKTKAETARLWLFLSPFIALASAWPRTVGSALKAAVCPVADILVGDSIPH